MLVGLLNLGDVGTTHVGNPSKSKFYFWFLVFGWNIKEGIGVWVLAEMAGHVDQTTQCYVDVDEEQIQRIKELIK